MDLKVAALLVLGLFAVTGSAGRDLARPATEYLRKGSIARLKYEQTLPILRKIVEKHGSSDASKTAELFESLNLDFYWASKGELSREEDKYGLIGLSSSEIGDLDEIKSYLSELQIPGRSCHPLSWKIYLDVANIIYGNDLEMLTKERLDGYDVNFHKFLKQIGSRGVYSCISEAIRTREEPPVGEILMDAMLARGLGLAGADDEKLLAALIAFDLRTSKLKVSAALQAVGGTNLTKELNIEHLMEELTKSCANLDEKFSEQLNVYNLGRLLEPNEVRYVKTSVRFMKLNEYHRICLPLTETKTRDDSVRKIKENLSKEKTGCFKKILNKMTCS